jgi:hypothetical protein
MGPMLGGVSRYIRPGIRRSLPIVTLTPNPPRTAPLKLRYRPTGERAAFAALSGGAAGLG